MRLPEQYRVAEELERYLGDPHEPRNSFSFAQAVALDEAEAYPEQACAQLNEWGLQDFYVPAQWGGRLSSYEQLISLLRVVARRDFTVGFAYSILSLLGSAATWAGGSDGQRRKVAQLLKDGKQIILAYNEKAHGGDFLATDVKAVKVSGGYLLSGEKWLIGNAVRCAALTVVARTRDEGGPRGFSLFLVDKSALDPNSFNHLPRIKTLGVRGAHVSGIRFTESFVSDESLIGAEGTALEQTLKAFQLTRTVIPALSLGAADTALRTTLDFALSRTLYSTTVWSLPHARRILVEAFLDLLIAECMTIAYARAVHQTPEQMRLYSAVGKYFVASSLEETIERLAIVLGARHYLREGHWHGIFQKIVRDNVVVRYHFNAALNLTTIGVHLRDLGRYRADSAARTEADMAQMEARLAAIFTLHHPLAAFNPDALSLYSRGRDDVLHGLDSALVQLRRLTPRTSAEEALLSRLIAQIEELLVQRQVADDEQQGTERELRGAYGRSPEMFEQAERYCVLQAAACCLHLWIYNRETLGEFFGRGAWLVLSLERLLRRLGVRRTMRMPAEYEESVAEELERLCVEEKLFSIVPIQLARSGEEAGRGGERGARAERAGEELTVTGTR
jgi:alkylation response protein AidB-like acyl-CoA dehydrogenase